MMMKIVGHSGGFQGSWYELDALPHAGEVLQLGNWRGTVDQVTHIPARFRTDDDRQSVAHIELVEGSVHRLARGAQ